MVYRNKANKKFVSKKGYGRHGKYGYFGRAGTDATRALKMAGKALSLLNVEYKHSDLVAVAAPYAGTAIINLLTGVAQGDTGQTRDGDSAKLTSLAINARCSFNGTASFRTVIRMALVHDLNTTQTVPNLSDIYDTSGGALEILAHRNLVNSHRFKILKEWIFYIDPATGPTSKQIQFYQKFQNHHIKFDGSAALDQTDGRIYLVSMSDSNLANVPFINWTSRIRYLDN